MAESLEPPASPAACIARVPPGPLHFVPLVPVRGGRGRILGWRRKYCNRTLAAALSAHYSPRGRLR